MWVLFYLVDLVDEILRPPVGVTRASLRERLKGRDDIMFTVPTLRADMPLVAATCGYALKQDPQDLEMS